MKNPMFYELIPTFLQRRKYFSVEHTFKMKKKNTLSYVIKHNNF